jgi:ribosome-associated toxin RatA of RatAB toxin-antitoxin module
MGLKVRMTIIKRSALVSYSARQMFELVNNIEDYPRFLPWCGAARILQESPTQIEAELDIVWKGIRKSFTTRNFLHPYDHMEIQLVTGPFRHLEGRWVFTTLNGQACKISLDMQFEFAGNALDKLFQPIFNYIANSLVDAFCKRATEIYGQH